MLTRASDVELRIPSRGYYSGDVSLVAAHRPGHIRTDGWPERHGTLPATQGLTYRIVVMSYRPPEALEPRAEGR